MDTLLGIVLGYRFADGYECRFRLHEFSPEVGAASILDWLEERHGRAVVMHLDREQDVELGPLEW